MKKNRTTKNILRSRNSGSKRMYKTSGRVRDQDDLLKRKSKTDHDGPQPFDKYSLVKKWFRANVGRPWDVIYSEFCKKFRRNTPEGFFAHRALESTVFRNTVKIDGLMCRRRFGITLPLEKGDLYVDPNDSILKRIKRDVTVRRANS